MHDAARAPPPPVLAPQRGRRARGRARGGARAVTEQRLPRSDRLAPHRSRAVEDAPAPIERQRDVRRGAHQQRRDQSAPDRAAVERAAIHRAGSAVRRRRGPRRSGEVVGQPEAADREQPVPGGLSQVVGDLGRGADQVADGAEQPVSQVVVADRITGQPRVGRRERVAGGHRHQQHQIHRLLGVVGGGVVGSHQAPTEERHHLQQLDGDDQTPATLHPLHDLRGSSSARRTQQ